MRVRIAAYAFCLDRGRVLLCRIAADNPDSGRWTLPGGGLDPGEHPEAGMARELHEETGLTGEIRGLVGVDSVVYDPPPIGSPFQSIRIVYDVACRGEPQVVEVDGSVDLSQWIPLADLGGLDVVDLVEYALETAGIR
jgi:8-oxo-dGTP pyrophosphatase MutT (NUDIX family)